MLRISGFDKIARELDQAQKAISLLDGELGSVSFDPSDAASIESAIRQVNLLIDERLADYSSNSIIGPVIADLKEKYREGIIQRAAMARLEEDQE